MIPMKGSLMRPAVASISSRRHRIRPSAGSRANRCCRNWNVQNPGPAGPTRTTSFAPSSPGGGAQSAVRLAGFVFARERSQPCRAIELRSDFHLREPRIHVPEEKRRVMIVPPLTPEFGQDPRRLAGSRLVLTFTQVKKKGL